jgi:hypothetical protein
MSNIEQILGECLGIIEDSVWNDMERFLDEQMRKRSITPNIPTTEITRILKRVPKVLIKRLKTVNKN